VSHMLPGTGRELFCSPDIAIPVFVAWATIKGAPRAATMPTLAQ